MTQLGVGVGGGVLVGRVGQRPLQGLAGQTHERDAGARGQGSGHPQDQAHELGTLALGADQSRGPGLDQEPGEVEPKLGLPTVGKLAKATDFPGVERGVRHATRRRDKGKDARIASWRSRFEHRDGKVSERKHRASGDPPARARASGRAGPR